MNALVTQAYKIDDIAKMADAIAASGLFGMKTPQQAMALMLVAQAEGMHPATITQDYDIIQGKAARKTHSVLARFQQMGGKVEWNELSDTVADATFSHPSGGSLRIQWTFAQAKQAKLTDKDNWKNYPRAMLRARCIAEGIRAVYPAAIGGMLVAEEAKDLEPKDMGAAEVVGQSQVDRQALPKQPALPPYSDEQFAVDRPGMENAIKSGRRDTSYFINTLSTMYSLTDEQKAAIDGLAGNVIDQE